MLNDRMLVSSEKSAPEDYQIIGNPHVDGTKLVQSILPDSLAAEITSIPRFLQQPMDPTASDCRCLGSVSVPQNDFIR